MTRDETGSIVTLFGLALAVGALVLVLLVDLVAYLAAASRAQAAADAAAMAAVTVSDPRARSPGDPQAEARRVAEAATGRVESCVCRPGLTFSRVEVSVEVPAIVVTRLAGRRVRATSEAELRPPSRAPAG